MTTATETYDPEAIARACVYVLMGQMADFDATDIELAAGEYRLPLPDETDDDGWDDQVVPHIKYLAARVLTNIGPVTKQQGVA